MDIPIYIYTGITYGITLEMHVNRHDGGYYNPAEDRRVLHGISIVVMRGEG